MSKLATVLHVDDSEDDRMLLHYAMRKSQNTFAVQSVNGGQAAIDYLGGAGHYHDRERFPMPVLVLLDIKMPGMTGFDVLKWIRAQPPVKNTAVAILSSSNDEGDVRTAYALGAGWYLMKPIDYDDMKRLVALVAGWLADAKRNDLSKSPHFKAPPEQL